MGQENLILHKLFSSTARQLPDSVALQAKKDNQWSKFTYKQLDLNILKIASFLVRQGCKKGDSAVLLLENRPQWSMIYLGVVSAGLVCVPIDRQLSVQEIRNLVLDSAAKIIFCSWSIFEEKFKSNFSEYPLKFILLDSPAIEGPQIIDFAKIQDIQEDLSLLPDVSDDDIASLIYTSGTTAKPKGVLLTHKNLCSDFKSIAELNIYLPTDNILSILPLHHTYSFMVTLVLPLLVGGRVTYALSFKPHELQQIIKEAGVTILVGVPQLFSLLHKAIFERIKRIPGVFMPLFSPFIKKKLRSQFGALRLLVSGGARLEPKINRDLSSWGFTLVEGYGLTETSPVVTLNPPEKVKYGSVGKPIPRVEIKILDPDKSGVGQVLIKGPNVMQGYFRQPEATNQVIQQGWFYSGDLGWIDKDGYLYLTGREKDVIVLSSGKNIYPEELEDYYSRSPYIKEICILSKAEQRFGQYVESLYAVIVPDLEYFQQKKEADIRSKIRWELENLAKDTPSYQHIMGFTVTKEELPRTALKKLKRYEVRGKYLQEKNLSSETKKTEYSPEDNKIISLEIAPRIMEYLRAELKKPVFLDSHLEIDLGIDSLTRVQLGLGLGVLLNIDIPDELLYSVSTVGEAILKLHDFLQRHSAGKKDVAPKDWGQVIRELYAQKKQPHNLRLQSNILDTLLILTFKVVFLFTFRLFWRLRIKGRSNIPLAGSYLICPNHASYLDGFVVFVSLPLACANETFYLGDSTILAQPLIKWANRLARLVPVDAKANFTEAMQYVAFVLLHKKIFCIFPEGRRSIDDKVKEFKKGVGILIKELDIPVLPVYIKGSHRSWPRNSLLPRFCPLEITFGSPLHLKELLNRHEYSGNGDDYEVIANNLREEVLRLGDTRY